MGYQPTSGHDPLNDTGPLAAPEAAGEGMFATTASMQSLLFEHFAALQNELAAAPIETPEFQPMPVAPQQTASVVAFQAPAAYTDVPELDDEALILAQLTAGAARVVADITEETRLKAEAAANSAPSYAAAPQAPSAVIRPVEDLPTTAGPAYPAPIYDIPPYELPVHTPGAPYVQAPSLKMVPMPAQPVTERKPESSVVARSYPTTTPQPQLDPNDPAAWPLSAKLMVEDLKAENDKLKAALREEASRALMAESLAETDVLTPTLNRRGFMRELQRAIADCKRYGEKACVIFLDLDGFKLINDTYGHGAGDAALVHVATVLSQNIREGDAVGRIGGDEFALLLRRAELQPTRIKAMMLEAELSVSTFAYKDLYLKIGGSFGVRAFMGQSSADEWLAEADAAMFLVKKSIR